MDWKSLLHHPLVQTSLVWALLGLFTGVAAKLLLPGSENMGWIRTILVGLAGSFVGNILAPMLFHWPQYSPFSLAGAGLGILGALVLVIVNRVVTRS